MDDIIRSKARSLLKRFYGYDSFRPLQEDIISEAMNGRDMLVLMPTGGGKSVCYQIPALMSKGVTIVVSPLIALMNDQVDSLLGNGIPAAAIHSNQSDEQNRQIMDLAYNRRLKLLYISPERLLLEIDRLGDGLDVALIAIDEAHCISQWGHDFRPEYTQLARLKERFPKAPVMALTATADRTTREDISRQLNLSNPCIFISSFDRPNISLRVVAGAKKKEKTDTIARLYRKYPGDSGIVYCMSRNSAEKMSTWLNDIGIPALYYHAGMSASERNTVQQRFINGDIPVVCATVAFGMGIDKSNIRWVVHNNMPQSIESYYQEIGRAGRDGLPAEAVMFYSVADLIVLERFIAESGQMKLNSEKLTRMRQYADATVCRRRVLLSYFNEETDHDCGNCDICLDPPVRRDATLEAQMALSAVVRTDGRAGMSMLIDILRGSRRADIIEKGYDRLKTFGVGRNVSYREWDHLITQMVQIGLIDIFYSDGGRLGVTDYGRRVLYGKANVELTPLSSRISEASKSSRKKETQPISIDPDQLLFSQLKEVRTSFARELGVPAYIVFSDRTLNEIASRKPLTREEFSEIYGVSEKKTERYWAPFVNAVRSHQGLPPLDDDNGINQRIIDALHSASTPKEAADMLGMSQKEMNRRIARMIDNDRFNEFALVVGRGEFVRLLEMNRTMSETQFRQHAAMEFAPGLDDVAIAMASYMLRHRN